LLVIVKDHPGRRFSTVEFPPPMVEAPHQDTAIDTNRRREAIRRNVDAVSRVAFTESFGRTGRK